MGPGWVQDSQTDLHAEVIQKALISAQTPDYLFFLLFLGLQSLTTSDGEASRRSRGLNLLGTPRAEAHPGRPLRRRSPPSRSSAKACLEAGTQNEERKHLQTSEEILPAAAHSCRGSALPERLAASRKSSQATWRPHSGRHGRQLALRKETTLFSMTFSCQVFKNGADGLEPPGSSTGNKARPSPQMCC